MVVSRIWKKRISRSCQLAILCNVCTGNICCSPMILAVNYDLEDEVGAYTAFGQNLMISVLFVKMLMPRKRIEDQSFYIALFEMTGTGLSSLAFFLYRPIAQDSFLLQFFFIVIFAFDLIYTTAIYRGCRTLENPLKRF